MPPKCCDEVCFTELVKCYEEGGYKKAWGWTASTGQKGPFPYHPPSPWGYDPDYEDEYGPFGSHGGCPGCIMTLVHLRKPLKVSTHKTTAEFPRFVLTKEVPLDTDDVCIAKCVIRNSGTDEGIVYFKLDELNSDGSVKANICTLLRAVDLVRCYSPIRDCKSRDAAGRCRAYDCRIGTYGGCEYVPLHDLRITTPAGAGIYYYGIKTWGEGEAEPSYPVPDSPDQPVNAKAWSIVCETTPTPTPTPTPVPKPKKVMFDAKKEDGTVLTGVEVWIDGEKKGTT
ncbi:MAG: hypothetical protein N2V72_00450 [Methanophagales archaeon]|nr:hypothetical protein [Methanophagales archaeon]